MNTRFIVTVLVSLFLIGCASTKQTVITTTKTQEEQQALSPRAALDKLKMGNERFLTNTQHERDLHAQVADSEKQYPFAVILGCMDSRGAPEIIFDQGIGDIFTQRIAGNIVNRDILGGLEYATKVVGAKVVLVLGHTSCGAVGGACEHVELGNLTHLLDKIEPAVKRTKKRHPHMTCKDPALINSIAEQNVRNVINNIKKGSPVLRKMIDNGSIIVAGGMHDLATGKVSFLNE